MSKTLLADSMQKLKETRPDAPAWIMDRAEAIADQRLEQASREAFIKGAGSVLSGAFLRGASLGLSAMLNIFDRPDYAKARQDARKKTISGASSIGQSFEWAFENMRLATCDYITSHDVPLDTFNNEEQKYLFPSGIPTKDQNHNLHAEI